MLFCQQQHMMQKILIYQKNLFLALACLQMHLQFLPDSGAKTSRTPLYGRDMHWRMRIHLTFSQTLSHGHA